MKKQLMGFVLILEITAICILHALKMSQADPSQVKSAQKIITPEQNQQKEVFLRQLAFNK